MLCRSIPILLALTLVPSAAHASSDPFVGTWDLSFGDSKIAQNPGLKSKRFEFAPAADGTIITETIELSSEPGKKQTSTIRYAEGALTTKAGPGLDALLVTKTNQNTALWTVQANGQIASQLEVVVSPDRKRMTFRYLWRASDKTGSGYNDRYVYVRK